MLILCFFIQLLDPTWQLEDTELFLPIAIAQVVITEEGNFFLLDAAEKTVLRYDVDGNKLSNLGREGQGPGEFSSPRCLGYLEGVFYVYENYHISVFSKAGKFLKRILMPRDILYFYKMKNGWVGYRGIYYHQHSDPLELIWFSDQLDKRTTIASWASEETRVGKKDPEIRILTEEMNSLDISRDGSFAFAKPAGVHEVSVFDLDKMKISHSMKIEGPDIPFDVEWGERLIKETGSRRSKIKFPEYFPRVADISVSMNDILVVSKFTAMPFDLETSKRHYDIVAFAKSGEKVILSAIESDFHRVVGVRAGFAYCTIFNDESEEYTIARCPMDRLSEFIRKHPMPRYHR